MGSLNLATRENMSNNEVSVVELSGVLDFNTVTDFENLLTGMFRKNRFKIIVDMEKLTYISSAGIGVLVGNIKEVRRNKGDIKIGKVNPDVLKVFELLDLHKIIQFCKTEQDAAKQF